MNLSSSKLKKLLLSFLREPLRVFITISSDFFYLTIDFYCCFRVFSLLTAFVHFTKFTGFYHCFLRCFYFTTDFDYFFGWFDLINILSSFLYCLATCSADLREHFWFSGVFFYLLSFPKFGRTCFYQDFQPTVLIWRLRGHPLRFEIQTRSVCLFESHSVQQKVLVGRFYLCIKAIQNTISTCFRFWTHYHYLIPIYIYCKVHVIPTTEFLNEPWFIGIFICCLLIHKFKIYFKNSRLSIFCTRIKFNTSIKFDEWTTL